MPPRARSRSLSRSADSPTLSDTSGSTDDAESPPSPDRRHSLQLDQASQHGGDERFASQDHVAPGGQLANGAGNGEDVKRPRACEACRGLKVRCEQEASDPDGPCKRCRKARRNCVVTVPTRKRQKKTDSRVAELEKKIDALTASLHARGGNANSNSGSANGSTHGNGVGTAAGATAESSSRPSGETTNGYNIPWGGNLARHWSVGSETQNGDRSSQTPGEQRPSAPGVPPNIPAMLAGMKRKWMEAHSSDARPGPAPGQASGESDYVDIVAQGILTIEKAAELFAKYNERMAPHLPAVVFIPGTTVSTIRRTRPILFLAIMGVASCGNVDLQRSIVKELFRQIAERVVVRGEKNIDLVLSLVVSVIWYYPPEHFEELKFYQLVHMAAVMGIDIGLGRRRFARGIGPGPPMIPHHGHPPDVAATPHPSQQCQAQHLPPRGGPLPYTRRTPPVDPTTIESRRAWLACYYLASNCAMALHRPNLIRWTPFMAESVEVLTTSPDALPSDRYFCHLVWTHRLAEEVGVQFSMEETGTGTKLTDMRTQHVLRGLERELEKYRAGVPPDHLKSTLVISFNIVNLYMHELALQADSVSTKDSTNSPPSPRQHSAPAIHPAAQESLIIPDSHLTSAHISAISACLQSIQGVFETFLAMDVEAARTLPGFNFVRVAYALVVLIKIYFAASKTGSEVGKVLDGYGSEGPGGGAGLFGPGLGVEGWIDRLLERFLIVSGEGVCRPAGKFMVILVMLRSWFLKQMKGDEQDGQGPGQQTRPSQASTPRPQERNEPDDPRTLIPPRPATGTPVFPVEYSAPTTPLHLLSEVATGDPRNSSTLPPWLRANQNSQPLFADQANRHRPPQSCLDDSGPTSAPPMHQAQASQQQPRPPHQQPHPPPQQQQQQPQAHLPTTLPSIPEPWLPPAEPSPLVPDWAMELPSNFNGDLDELAFGIGVGFMPESFSSFEIGIMSAIGPGNGAPVGADWVGGFGANGQGQPAGVQAGQEDQGLR